MKNRLTASVFCFLLFIFFVAVSIITWPRYEDIAIGEAGGKAFDEIGKKRYVIKGGTYEVLNEFAEFNTQNSTFLYPIKYNYFNVLITDKKGDSFIIAVRTGKKSNSLRQGKSIELSGMVSYLDEKLKTAQEESLLQEGKRERVYNLSLNDNDVSVASNYIQSVLFAVFAVLDLLFIFLIWLRK